MFRACLGKQALWLLLSRLLLDLMYAKQDTASPGSGLTWASSARSRSANRWCMEPWLLLLVSTGLAVMPKIRGRTCGSACEMERSSSGQDLGYVSFVVSSWQAAQPPSQVKAGAHGAAVRCSKHERLGLEMAHSQSVSGQAGSTAGQAQAAAQPQARLHLVVEVLHDEVGGVPLLAVVALVVYQQRQLLQLHSRPCVSALQAAREGPQLSVWKQLHAASLNLGLAARAVLSAVQASLAVQP